MLPPSKLCSMSDASTLRTMPVFSRSTPFTMPAGRAVTKLPESTLSFPPRGPNPPPTELPPTPLVVDVTRTGDFTPRWSRRSMATLTSCAASTATWSVAASMTRPVVHEKGRAGAPASLRRRLICSALPATRTSFL